MLPPLILQDKDKYCTVYGPVPNQLPVISLSARFHDKTVETVDNPVYNVLFCFFFVNVFFCLVSRDFQHNLFVCNILSKRPLKHRTSAQNTFIDVTILKIMVGWLFVFGLTAL